MFRFCFGIASFSCSHKQISGNILQKYAKLYKAVCVFDIYKVAKVMKLKSACVILYYPVHYVYIIPKPHRISQIDRKSKNPQTARKNPTRYINERAGVCPPPSSISSRLLSLSVCGESLQDSGFTMRAEQ